MVEKSAVEEVIAEPLEVGLSVSEEIDDSLDSTFELVLMFDSTLERLIIRTRRWNIQCNTVRFSTFSA